LTEAEAAELTDAEALERLALPDPATLEHGADFRAFLRAGVPKRLQRLALRRLWAVSPGGAALDGLVDYAEDFTDAAVAVADRRQLRGRQGAAGACRSAGAESRSGGGRGSRRRRSRDACAQRRRIGAANSR
jgi:hypothetical protein